MFVILLVCHLVLSKWHISDCHIKEIVRIICLFKACDFNVSIWICILYSLYKLILSQHNKSSYHQFSIWTLSITVYFVQPSLLILPMLYIQLHFLLIRNNLFLPSIKKILLYNLHHTFQEYILLHPSYDLI